VHGHDRDRIADDLDVHTGAQVLEAGRRAGRRIARLAVLDAVQPRERAASHDQPVADAGRG
jgi:hypothetical protein